ncbi:nucleotidyltransferase family protein [Pricia sp.]|uniref:nucleotidyltransferase family protein n=1 Tax=Pricia sp. TaxID=2268138 RepID=UPI003593B57D
MIPLLQKNRDAIIEICKKFEALELYVFGSALSDEYNSEKSDIDLAVIFDSSIPVENMADHYFGLIEELEKLLKRPVDLITLVSVKNKIFKKELENTMVPLYAA